ncbi:E3 ubiquitin-protein ligase SPL2-like [Chenopodium quinoa]|uniref:E3 ubiquitin-protein ligase SPL2-like n=1 Tax=Chenopodium quinoa TaxID=63459 RepID=UPI000B794553|nr:E3 ubiquitin-protein ligase SPL2-like [Chenopodium quinoa]
MSVILSTISSAALAYFASLEKAKTQQAYDTVETLRGIPEYHVSGLQTLISSLPHHDIKKIVFLRGVVLPSSLVKNLTSGGDASDTAQGVPESSVEILHSPKTHQQQAVVVERSIIHGYYERSNFLGFINKKQEGKKVVSKARKQVPFIIAENTNHTISILSSKYVVINLEDTDVQIPLQKVSSDKREIFTHSDNNGFKLQVDEITEENILPVGDVISAVGIFSLENGVPNIKPYKGLPYFLTSKSKEELVAELSAQLENATDWSETLSNWSVGLAGFAIGALLLRIALRASK